MHLWPRSVDASFIANQVLLLIHCTRLTDKPDEPHDALGDALDGEADVGYPLHAVIHPGWGHRRVQKAHIRHGLKKKEEQKI